MEVLLNNGYTLSLKLPESDCFRILKLEVFHHFLTTLGPARNIVSEMRRSKKCNSYCSSPHLPNGVTFKLDFRQADSILHHKSTKTVYHKYNFSTFLEATVKSVT